MTEPAEESPAPSVLVAVCRERADGERRVALTPEEVKRLGEAGARVRLERGAGTAAGYPDESYALNGAELVADAAAALTGADVVLRVAPPGDDEIAALPADALLISYLRPLDRPELSQALAARGLTALAVELVPRITRAQTMDALSSQANIAGYRAVLVASTLLPRYFPLLMTAAGTVPPAKVLVLGAGVAGLQAIATARRLGAVVSAFDVRPAVREQVESLGATFLEVDLPETGETSGGYAQELSEETQRRQRELLAEHVAASDVVVTTALVPGRPAPQLIGADMVASMRPGSVIVDLAAEAGGNCELTEPGQTVVREHVTIVGDRNPAAAMPYDASRLYARNLTELLAVCLHEGRVAVDPEDSVIAGCLVCRGGVVVHPAVLERLK
ncbi:MAG TPA: Re/Si-specific NAD(P)(+) transhydrogenase subunit alpha [Gaiellales bacterium]|nr:Re/Si-specific NAD(P)(+) transhydrogenase subunit alpha [Gaiellales bacterium]